MFSHQRGIKRLRIHCLDIDLLYLVCGQIYYPIHVLVGVSVMLWVGISITQ